MYLLLLTVLSSFVALSTIAKLAVFEWGGIFLYQQDYICCRHDHDNGILSISKQSFGTLIKSSVYDVVFSQQKLGAINITLPYKSALYEIVSLGLFLRALDLRIA